MAGLNGAGAAKTWMPQPPRYVVGFNALAKFVRARVETEVKRMAGVDADRFVQVPQIQILGAASGSDPELRSLDPRKCRASSSGCASPLPARENGRGRVITYNPGGVEVPVASQPPPLERRDIYVVGYPSFDFRTKPTVANQVFGMVFNVKRVLPGRIVYLADDGALHHDAYTLPGTAGGASSIPKHSSCSVCTSWGGLSPAARTRTIRPSRSGRCGTRRC